MLSSFASFRNDVSSRHAIKILRTQDPTDQAAEQSFSPLSSLRGRRGPSSCHCLARPLCEARGGEWNPLSIRLIYLGDPRYRECPVGEWNRAEEAVHLTSDFQNLKNDSHWKIGGMKP